MGLLAVLDKLRLLGPYAQGKMGPQALFCPAANRYSITDIGLFRTMDESKGYSREAAKEREGGNDDANAYLHVTVGDEIGHEGPAASRGRRDAVGSYALVDQRRQAAEGTVYASEVGSEKAIDISGARGGIGRLRVVAQREKRCKEGQ